MMNDNGQLSFIDILSILSFGIALENLELNVTQEDAQNLQRDLSDKSNIILAEIHQHLEEQDKKLDKILEALNYDL